MTKEEWQKQLKERPKDEALWRAYADWCDEQGDQLESFKAKEKAGLGVLTYHIGCIRWPEARMGRWRILKVARRRVGKRLWYWPREGGRYFCFDKKEEDGSVRVHEVGEDEIRIVVRFEYKAVDVTTLPLYEQKGE